MEAFTDFVQELGSSDLVDRLHAYQQARELGLRKRAQVLSNDLAEALATLPPHHDVATKLANLGVEVGPNQIPHHVIVHIVAPRVLSEFERETESGRRWMHSWGIDLLQRIQTREATLACGWNQLQNLVAWTRISSNTTEAHQKLSAHLEKWFEFTLHELPSGVLCGMNGATIEECAELLAWLETYESSVAVLGGPNPAQADLISTCRLHYSAYAEYLAVRRPGDTYAGFLE